MFNKELYWKNRKEGKRGQTDYTPKPKLLKESDVTMTATPQGWEARTRKRQRRRVIDRTFVKKGFRAVKTKDGYKAIRVVE